jgi:hypothetical protein
MTMSLILCKIKEVFVSSQPAGRSVLRYASRVLVTHTGALEINKLPLLRQRL